MSDHSVVLAFERFEPPESSADYFEELRYWIIDHPHVATTDPSSADDRTDMDTLGTLIDKLITVDLKMWHNQEALYAIRRMTPTDFKEKYGNNLTELYDTIKRCCDLNVQRSKLMDAIDDHFAKVLSGELDGKPMHQHKTY